ncbi:DNA photolyase family protein [Acetobacteraceae bacterium KSS8]|uniref:DNA photolyase family protein n=1 Tax=Endosaccharibacter trunci TaxID=2812733 RepID=A0ABT1W5D9_9PROT|nr:DNA photolyase family protein [Acetobacteraceae bacterium KSS8]
MARKTSRSGLPGSVAILWLRHDLRLSDHRALAAALDEFGLIVPVFVLDESDENRWALGGASRWWLHHSLAALGAALRKRQSELVLRRGDSVSILRDLVRETGAAALFCGETHEPWLRSLTDAVEKAVGVPVHRRRVSTLFDAEAIRTKSGGQYSVYGPFARACRAQPEPEDPLPAPQSIPSPKRMPRSDALDDWGLLPKKPDWSGGFDTMWTPGEAGADKKLKSFLKDRLDGYGASRNVPGDPQGTSMLSPHLHWGEISPNQVWHAAKQAADRKKAKSGWDSFSGELLWHDFSAYLLRYNPEMPEKPLRAAYAKLPWRRDKAGMRAWQQGRTGIPIVDAGMRQLWRHGWMHNRVRMITASFLVKHMLVSWQDGEAWFFDTLVDADLATNAASWQWIGGCGTDSQPFFRVFNPVTQGKTHDPDGRYVRHYVPELKALPDRWLHCPWQAPQSVLGKAGLVLGRDYPKPILDLDRGRDRALDAYRKHVRGAKKGADA